jgi:hypothetical protein
VLLRVSTADEVYILYTTPVYDLDHFVMTTDQNALTFTVDACSDARIYLTYLPGVADSFAYGISLGIQDNLRSVIDKFPPNAESHSFSTTGILTCSAQSMWISWSSGLIQVGMGSSVGDNVQFEWRDSQPYSVNAFSLVSRDGGYVTWTFPRVFCK